MATTSTSTTTTISKTPNRFQILRQTIFNIISVDERATTNKQKSTDKNANTKRKGKNGSNTGGVFFKARSGTSLHPSDTSVSSGLPNIESTMSTSSSLNHSTTSLVQQTSWKSTERQSFLLNQPMMVTNIDDIDAEVENDPASALEKVMVRSKKLPMNSDYFNSIHVSVNEERVKRMIAPLSRLSELDQIARSHAEAMAKEQRLFHSDPSMITNQFQRPFRRMGENVVRGSNLRTIHTDMMVATDLRSERYNLLHRCYTHMGIGTAKCKDGKLYLCQIFRG